MKQIFSLDFHDYSPLNSNLGLLEDIHDHYPNCKITLFTVPWEIRWGEQTLITLPKYKPFVEATKKAVKQGWIEIGIHGLTHAPGEFLINKRDDLSDYQYFKYRLMAAQRIFERVKLPYVKLFVAPFWQLHPQAKKAVESLGFRVVEEKDSNWNIKDHYPKNKKIVKGHGHIQATCGNGLEESLPRILEIPVNAEWKFLSEILK